MKVYYEAKKLALLFFCLIFSFQIVFAQNTDNLKKDIYSKLKCCPCKESFEACVCPEAKEMKAYVEALLETGATKEDIFYKVAKKFSLKVISDEPTRISVEKKLIKDAGNFRPQIVLEPKSFDFGSVSIKQSKISKTFKLINKGNADLIVTSVSTSCPCAFVSLKINKDKSRYFGTEGSPKDSEFKIKRNQIAELEVIIDLKSPSIKVGKTTRAAFIKSNDPINPDVTAMIEMEVKE